MITMKSEWFLKFTIATVGTLLSLALLHGGRAEAVSSLQDAWLITPQEAAAPAAESPGGIILDVGRQESNLGPTIEILKPTDGGKASGPIEIQINFVPKTGPVDVNSLKVTVVKFLSIDITDRLREYVSASGIQVKEAKIPAGKHIVRISVADAQGVRSIKEIEFEVL
ncbi:MAG: hypothetical protein KF806_01520 [Nitrospira sp.]|nr:hypothetical protein [Nitrospira sp.]